MKGWKMDEKLYMQITEVNVIAIAKIMMWYKSKNSSYQYPKEKKKKTLCPRNK